MISFKELLTEAYSFSKYKKDDDSVSYYFNNKQGDKIFVVLSNGWGDDFWVDLVDPNAEPQELEEGELVLDIVFGNVKGSTWAMNNSGDGLAVLSTVKDILQKFIQQDFKAYGYYTLKCHPATEDYEETSRNSKRDRIYQTFVERAMESIPEVNEVHTTGEHWGDDDYEIFIEIGKP